MNKFEQVKSMEMACVLKTLVFLMAYLNSQIRMPIPIPFL